MTFKTTGIILFLILISFNTRCQNRKIDSLKLLVPKREGIDKANVLYHLGRQYNLIDQNIPAVITALEGYEIARNLNDSLMIVQNGRIAAAGLRSNGEVDSAIRIYERILPLSMKYKKSLPHLFILNGLALCYTFTAEYDKALPLFFQYLEGNRNSHNAGGESMALNNIGLVYYKLKDYRKAKGFFVEAIALKRKINDNYDLGAAFINLGLCDAYLGNYADAKENVLKGLKVNDNNSSAYEFVCAEFAMGVIYFGLREYGNAEHHFLKSYHLAEKNDYGRFQFDNVDYLSQMYLMQKPCQ
ncbi:tetratricopeptide repeat protein [Fulvivirgaceae bacterium PWU4]|uniref:Tetratricopeptide repeat protein n=1 Tax=Chryseosolibacter histidini TaxID=2782349 RepID=A0AAP2DQV8_9BACT|nr:tetratricopeptide repeat protein [Chryseosolibacter histidini]MBT1699342.1 tetratricopeptide repeat protein [Chryseosolibacter histidini]